MKNNTITIPWQNQKDIWWNKTCADVMEHFGLPGGRYVTEVSTDCMKFHFNTEQDALMCKLLISDQI
jgi:hypothetical protein